MPDAEGTEPAPADVLQVDGLVKEYGVSGRLPVGRQARRPVRAVDGVSFSLARGRTLCLVGESGCGKSTVARSMLRLVEPTAGTIRFRGIDVTRCPQRDLRAMRRDVQVVFQDPLAALNPRLTVRELLVEPLRAQGRYRRAAADARVREVLDLVGLASSYVTRFAHEVSGGQRQRVGIARALMLDPSVLVLDEAVSALDVSIQAQVLNLLTRLQRELGLAYLFITHDLSVVNHVGDDVAVMYLGRIVERGACRDVLRDPRHPYTRALLSAVPNEEPGRGDRRRIILRGDLPSLDDLPSGCAFRTRCWMAHERCADEVPTLTPTGAGRPAACFYADDDTDPFAAAVPARDEET